MPYLEVTKDNDKTIEKKEEVIVPKIEGMPVAEAEKELKEKGLGISIITEEIDKKTAIVKKQLPKNGIKVYKNTNIIIETE